VTLVCEGHIYALHSFVLSSCSEYFKDILQNFKEEHPCIVLADIRRQDLDILLNYMYIGEVNVRQSALEALVDVAECLRIKGLAVSLESPTMETNSSDNKSFKRKRKDTVNSEVWKNIGKAATIKKEAKRMHLGTSTDDCSDSENEANLVIDEEQQMDRRKDASLSNQDVSILWLL